MCWGSGKEDMFSFCYGYYYILLLLISNNNIIILLDILIDIIGWEFQALSYKMVVDY